MEGDKRSGGLKLKNENIKEVRKMPGAGAVGHNSGE